MLNGIKLNRYIYAVIVLAVFAGFFGTAKTASAGIVCGSWSPTDGLWRNTPQTFTLTGSYINCPAGAICYDLEISGGSCTVNHDYIKPTSALDPRSPYNNSNGCDVVINNPYHTKVCHSPTARIDTVSPAMSVTPLSGTTGTSISYTAYWQDTLSGLSSCIIYLDGSWYTTTCSGTGQVSYSGSFTTAGNHSVQLWGKDIAGNSAYFPTNYAYTYTVACNPASVTNGKVAATPGCAITCNSGYYLSGTTCVAPTLKANGVASSVTIPYNTAASLTWTSTDATSCTGTNFSTGGALNNSTGVSTGNLYGTQTYSISCTGIGGTANSNVVVHVLPVYGTCSGTSCTLQTGIEGQSYPNLCSTNCTTASYCGGTGGGSGSGSSWHSVCANNACVVVNGAGTNQCSTDLNCGGSGYPTSYFGVCAQGACVMVKGTPNTCEAAGVSTCSNYGGTCPNPTGSSYTLNNSSGDLKISITDKTGTVDSNNITLWIEPLSNYSDTITLSVADWGGLSTYTPTANFSRTTLISTQYASGATLKISVPVTVPSGTYYITVRGTAPTKTVDLPASPVKVIIHNAASSTWREM